MTTDHGALLEHFNMYDPDHVAIKQDLYAYAREHCPIPFTDNDEGFYMMTRFEDVKQVLLDPGSFSSTGLGPRPVPININPLNVDPPYQIELRKLLNPLFSRAALRRFEPEMRSIAASNIAGWIDREQIDLTTDFAIPVVAESLALITFEGIDQKKMFQAADIAARVGAGDESCFLDLLTLAAEYLVTREEEGVSAGDRGLVPVLLTGTVEDGRLLTEEERLGVLAVMFLGGLDTTRGAIGSIAYETAIDPSLEERIRDPQWGRKDLDEILRYISPLGTLARTVTRDVSIGNRCLHAGDRILVHFESANRDAERFDDPDRMDFDNPRPTNMAFGLGVHRCLGMHVAQLQIEIAFDELFARITKLRLGDGDVVWGVGVTNGPDHLPLRFDRV